MSNTIHIGLPKTGTTFLQLKVFPELDLSYFSHHSAAEHGQEKARDFRKIVEACTFGCDYWFEDAREDLKQHAINIKNDRKKDLLISNEAFGCENYAISMESISHRLRALFGPAKIIVCVRSPDDYLRSYYLHVAKLFGRHHRSFSFEEFVDIAISRYDPGLLDHQAPTYNKVTAMGNISPLTRLRFDRLIGHYDKAFGSKNVKVFCYEELFTVEGLKKLIAELNAPPLSDEYLETAVSNRLHESIASLDYFRAMHAGQTGLRYLAKYPYSIARRLGLKGQSIKEKLLFTPQQRAYLEGFCAEMIDRANPRITTNLQKLEYDKVN